ncbi:hypothetical protein C2W64_01865 [Brevibacillus laterosporus]|uniref:DUF3888 domain-containing protein n=1 Tax=Brevibacillus laterosporus TaxID=1465 RepID=A0A518V9R0_BRELA|nr:hypothetical protein EEL30_16405 [Brevibacillus laterosporus]RAP30669.1 hypothetical protein C2W64_01865 [Brevibacillus laterosporus]
MINHQFVKGYVNNYGCFYMPFSFCGYDKNGDEKMKRTGLGKKVVLALGVACIVGTLSCFKATSGCKDSSSLNHVASGLDISSTLCILSTSKGSHPSNSSGLAIDKSASISNCKEEYREQLLEGALINRYVNLIGETLQRQFGCEKIVAIKRLGDSNIPFFEVTVQVMTYGKEYHHPPYDAVILVIRDRIDLVSLAGISKKRNISKKEYQQECRCSQRYQQKK